MEVGYIGKLGTCLHAHFYEKLTTPQGPHQEKRPPNAPSTVSGHSLLSGVWEHPLYPQILGGGAQCPKFGRGTSLPFFLGGAIYPQAQLPSWKIF